MTTIEIARGINKYIDQELIDELRMRGYAVRKRKQAKRDDYGK